jgi:diguanylate cyclase (GGDEF)-like protein/putative nucleotidyltransferase with HDIG domain
MIPIRTKEKLIGILILGNKVSEQPYYPEEQEMLMLFCHRISSSLENAQLYAQAEQRARIDELTGLGNRRYLEERIQTEISNHARYGGHFSLIILDVDSLKTINDSYGHLAGDKLLCRVSNIVKNAIRASDGAFRFGGDEFALLLPQTSPQDAFEVAERVRSRLTTEARVASFPITASFGLASWPGDGAQRDEIVAAADMALYYAKRSGGNQTHAISEILPSLTRSGTEDEVEQNKGAFSIIMALAAAVDAKDHYPHDHSHKVQDYAVLLARSLDLDVADVARISTCALLHDIGKISTSDRVLNKSDKLDTEEWEIVKRHPQLGADIVSHVPQLASCLPGILHHHENYDGSGYPAGLKGEAIPLDARIIALVDALVAMTSNRPYREALPLTQALEEIKRGGGTQFDPRLVEVFFSIINSGSNTSAP